ncbi:MAG: CbiX/SirB N-terminal domain-containing protein [Desulfamplus sp.]|nr:CbiX/SirB N-terminal domain-containing protein [Desulfamplus sp.]MBF0413865.1 CbiX/SirB N-terminal domain-containing protein [Desulfamplus sp.]
MKAMILLAHGSRRKESAQEIKSVADSLEAQAKEKGQFDAVRPAFMQFCGPNFYQVIEELIQKSEAGTQDSSNNLVKQDILLKEVVVLPYFISAGSHVSEDIPELIKKAREKYPDISFTVTPHLGKFQGLQRLMLEETY